MPGRRPPHFTQEQIRQALQKTNGMQFLAAKRIGCSQKTIERAIKRYAIVDEVVKQCHGERLDYTEDMLWKAIQKGEAWAICFFLKTKGKTRGYIERQEHTGEDGKPIRFIVEVPPKAETADEWMQQYTAALSNGNAQ